MPTFEGHDIDIDANDYVDACDTWERESLVTALAEKGAISVDAFWEGCSWLDKRKIVERLIEEGHVRRSMLDADINGDVRSNSERIYEGALDNLHGLWNLLSREDEDTIVAISKKFLG